MGKKRVNERKLGWGGWESGRGCVTRDTDLDACMSVSMCVCLSYIHVSVSCSCTLERGSLVGMFTPSLARSFFSSSLSIISCRECWGTRCACEPDGQNIPVWANFWASYPKKAVEWTDSVFFMQKILTSCPRLESSRSFTVRVWLDRELWFVER